MEQIMKAFRQIMLAICVILIASAFAGCGADTDSPDERPALDKIEYTNLNDSVSQKLLEDMLSGAGVSGNRIQGFFNRVDSFNESVREEWLTAGFEKAKPLDTKPYSWVSSLSPRCSPRWCCLSAFTRSCRCWV